MYGTLVLAALAAVIVLIAAMGSTALNGWLMTTDAYFGVPWVEAAHSLAAHGPLMLVFFHVAGVALASLRHRENLVLARVTGAQTQGRAGRHRLTVRQRRRGSPEIRPHLGRPASFIAMGGYF